MAARKSKREDGDVADAPVTPDDSGAAEIQQRFDEAHDKGYFGYSPDPTPRDNYTLAGVVEGLPTPETDADAKKAAADPEQVR